ncbi:MAG: hypothetical protein Q7J34_10280 [Bacteroidales bacterium]|jgi:hypothetical protein|nr:hypothetical protein [Bacteroidales bacterium]
MLVTRRVFPLLLMFALSSIFVACDDFEGEQTIPAYLAIDSISVKINSGYEGSASHAITDAWVYIDDQLIGAFELPALFPVLYTGKHTVTIRPGIKMNGMVEFRTYYPFFSKIEQEVDFTPELISHLKGTQSGNKIVHFVSYNAGTKFAWAENFEDLSITLDSTSKSTLFFELTPTGSESTFEGLHSGRVILDSDSAVFEVATSEEMALPQQGSPVMFELDYKNTNTFTVGIYAIMSDKVVQQPVLVLNPTNKWKKVYINLSPTVSSYTSAIKYKIFIGATLDNGLANGEILLDNLKLVHN